MGGVAPPHRVRGPFFFLPAVPDDDDTDDEKTRLSPSRVGRILPYRSNVRFALSLPVRRLAPKLPSFFGMLEVGE